jgi:ABC-type polysaccharide/polyol phosphate transport system ATPase subunit
MDRITIDVRNLSKRFGLYSSPAKRLKEILNPFRGTNGTEIWALKDVSFRVKHGECVGVVGRNGSGKSTLLQVLCGVLRPTSGEVEVNGRVSALLELGAGFHPEFSGRDNVYMNGALMGLSRREMDLRFQEIADFAEIGPFIEQPVRTYSSGMFVRLAFACAVNIAPDILIVDEALAVGDAYFKEKCQRKIMEFRRNGGSMLLVSHDMPVIKGLCDSVILLDRGVITEKGDPSKVVSTYQGLKT